MVLKPSRGAPFEDHVPPLLLIPQPGKGSSHTQSGGTPTEAEGVLSGASLLPDPTRPQPTGETHRRSPSAEGADVAFRSSWIGCAFATSDERVPISCLEAIPGMSFKSERMPRRSLRLTRCLHPPEVAFRTRIHRHAERGEFVRTDPPHRPCSGCGGAPRPGGLHPRWVKPRPCPARNVVGEPSARYGEGVNHQGVGP